ncbi:MAG: hypothetical protein IBX64_09735 [Actinobacteria bacterium]|nr:hypothetical protein [Actinomycetota bacterium]
MPRSKYLLFALVASTLFALIAAGGCITTKSTRPANTKEKGAIAKEGMPEVTIYCDSKQFKASPELARKIERRLLDLLKLDFKVAIGVLAGGGLKDAKENGIAVRYRGNALAKTEIFACFEPTTNIIMFNDVTYYTPPEPETTSPDPRIPDKYHQTVANIERAIFESGDKNLENLWRSTSESSDHLRIKLFIPNIHYKPLFYRAHISLENTGKNRITFNLSSTSGQQKFPFEVTLHNPDGSTSGATQYGAITSSTGRKIDLSNHELILKPGERILTYTTFLIEPNYMYPGPEYPYQDIRAAWLPGGIANSDKKHADVKPIDAEMRIHSSQREAEGFYYDPINPDKVKWITMEGGLGINTKVLFKENAPEKIRKIVGMINMGTRGRPSRDEDGISGKPRPIGIRIQLDNGETRFIRFAYKVTKNGNATHYEPYDDRFIVVGQRENRYITLFSHNSGVVDYLRNGWQKDMPVVPDVVADKDLYRPGDSVTISGDGSTAPEVEIFVEKSNARESYLVGRIPTKFGMWKWRGIVQREFYTLDGRHVRLNKGEYWFSAQIGEKTLEWEA